MGRMAYFPAKVKNWLSGRNDVYHSGYYDCLPGDEHHARDCRKSDHWSTWEKPPKTIFVLEDGKTLDEPESCNVLEAFCTLSMNWNQARELLDNDKLTVPGIYEATSFGVAYPSAFSHRQQERIQPWYWPHLYRVSTKMHDPSVYVLVDTSGEAMSFLLQPTSAPENMAYARARRNSPVGSQNHSVGS